MNARMGIDVSTFQGLINWKSVKSAGIQFAMIRGGFGRYELDARYEENYKNTKASGVPIGVYHYSYANTVTKARQEAEFVLKYIKGKQYEYPIAYDVEDVSLSKLSKKALTDIVNEFCKTVEKAGYYVVIYSSKSWLQDKLDMRKLARYDVWVAQWNDVCTYEGAHGLWQFSDKGKCAGIQGTVDLDYAYKDYPAIMKSKGLNGFKKVQAPREPKKGMALDLHNVPIYASSTIAKPTRKITGLYYLYDGVNVNGRFRVTPVKRYCGKTPIANYVTGWIDKGDVK